jgi:hypothetical protein
MPAHSAAMGNPSDDLYDLAPTSAVPVRQQQPVMTMSYQSAPAVKPARAAEPEEIRHVYLPLVLIGGGVAVETVAALLRERTWQTAMLDVSLEVFIGTAILLAGVMLAARLRGIQLGSFATAAMKLAAVAIGPNALERLLSLILDHVPLGGLVGWAISFVLYFALLGVFFDLDESDTWYCVWTIFLVQLAVYFALVFGVMRWK